MWFLFRLLCILFISTLCFGEEDKAESILKSENDPYFNVALGVSPFLGVFGAEYQRKNHAVGIGYPYRLSYRYFVSPYQDTKFLGVYLGKMSYDDVDETVDGIQYRDLDSEYIGAGAGYRWQ